MKNLNRTRLNTVGRKGTVIFTSTLFLLIWSFAAQAQRGMGDSEGVVRQIMRPCLVRISGKLQEVKTHPCENTTGKADLGVHLILKDKQGRELNVHLGPAPALSKTVKQLTVGRKLDLLVFRTDKMSPNQYVAQTLILGSRIIQLRDSDLHPYWAGSGFGQVTLSPSAKTTVDQRSAMRRNCYFYSWPKSWRQRCFKNGRRPRWRRRCREGIFCHEWQTDN